MMDQARWDRIEELLQRALDLEPNRRADFLAAACRGDVDLRGEVEVLLEREEEARTFMEKPAVARFAAGMSWTSPLVGRRISHYQVESLIGEGGMGEVYKARDENLQRTVALKVLPIGFTFDSARVRRFEQEALAASRLNHPNIITIYEVIHTSDANIIAAEYVEGQTLRELLTDPLTRSSLKLDVEKAIDIAAQAASALEAAHRAGIIHRDVKPENVMVRGDGLVKLLDFGIAKLGVAERQDGKAGDEPLEEFVDGPGVPPLLRPGSTVPGTVLGTPNYMSPEQARGEPLDGRADLFSLGLLLYEMVAGERLLAEPLTVRRLESEETRESSLPSDEKLNRVPEVLQRIVHKLLRPNLDDRYASAAGLLEDLNQLMRRREHRTARRMIGLSSIVLVAALTLVAFAAFLSLSEVWDEQVMADGHTAAVRQAVFSPDGRHLVSVAEDHRVIVWDYARREQLASLEAHQSEVVSVAFASDGQRFATLSSDGVAIVWDAERREQLSTWRDHDNTIGGLGFSPDGQLLVSSGAFGMIARETERWQRVFEFPDVIGRNLPFFPNGKKVMDQRGIVFDLATGRRLSDRLSEGENWIAVSPDAARIAALDASGNVSFYQLTPPDGRPRLLYRERAHHDHGRSIEFSTDGQMAASAAEHIVLWDVAALKRLAVLEHSAIVWSVAFSPDGRSLVSTHGDGSILQWDLAERFRSASFNGHSNSVRAVAFAQDGRRIATAGEDRSIIIWDAVNARKEAVLTGHQTRVNGVAFSRDDKWVASADQDGSIIVWDAARQQVEWRRQFRADNGYCVAISPDGRWVAATSGVFERATGRFVLDIFPQENPWGVIYGVAFSPDGRRLACVTDRGNVLVWSVEQWNLLGRQAAGNRAQISVTFSPDGQQLVTGDDAGVVRLWRAEPLEEVAVVGRHDARVKSVAFAPDGKTVASAGDDRTVALWDLRRRRLVSRLGTHTAPVYAIAFSPDGSRLVAGGHDRSVRVYTRRRLLWGWRLD